MAVEAHRTLDLCLDDNAPFGLIDLITGVWDGEHEGAAQG
jgi:hypothetical protein